MNVLLKTALPLIMVALLASCSQQPQKPDYQSTRYHVEEDFIPMLRVDPATVKDAIPRHEPVTKAGNKNPYTVLGKTYRLLPVGQPYKEKGGASWYGLKFHGHKTSNGEIYSVYGMTAAHKTLPIPSYVKVTNLANGRSCIVRVNDRGPFHPGRIIDLSYAAASKLGYIEQGTAQVEVELIDPDMWEQPVVAKAKPNASVTALKDPVVLQLGAFSQYDTAQQLYQQLYARYQQPLSIASGADNLHRVRLGPIEKGTVDQLMQQLLNDGFPQAVVKAYP